MEIKVGPNQEMGRGKKLKTLRYGCNVTQSAQKLNSICECV